MTRLEAIKILKAAETDHFPYEPEKLVEAFELAIASLETDEAYQLEYERMEKATWQQINKNEVNVIPQWKCSECGAEFECWDMDFEYCPRCGARMVEPQESEDNKYTKEQTDE